MHPVKLIDSPTTVKKETTTKSTVIKEKIKRKNYRNPAWAKELEIVEVEEFNSAEVEKIFEQRRLLLYSQCKKMDQDKPSVNSFEYLIDERHKLVWCSIFKSASSTWFYNFCLLAGIDTKRMEGSRTSPVQFARQTAYPRPSVQTLSSALSKNFTSFIIVREPFERLLSGFRDKIEAVNSYCRKLQCIIAKKPTNYKCTPTFEEFIDYIIEEVEGGGALNEHWHPYSSFCTVCAVNYSYILHFETLTEDENYLISQVSIFTIMHMQ